MLMLHEILKFIVSDILGIKEIDIINSRKARLKLMGFMLMVVLFTFSTLFVLQSLKSDTHKDLVMGLFRDLIFNQPQSVTAPPPVVTAAPPPPPMVVEERQQRRKENGESVKKPKAKKLVEPEVTEEEFIADLKPVAKEESNEWKPSDITNLVATILQFFAAVIGAVTAIKVAKMSKPSK